MVHGGVCLARLDDGTTVFVENAIPGELVEARLRFAKGRTWFAETAAVLEPSDQRVPAPCRYVPECGGCQLQHVSYARQLELKRGIVVDAFRRQQVPVPDVRVRGMDDPWRYRYRGEFHVVRGAGDSHSAGLGFNRVRSWTPIAVDDCLIHHARISTGLPLLRELVERGGSADLGTLHLTVGEGGDELLVQGKPRRALDSAAVDRVAAELPDGGRLSTEWTTLRWRDRTYRVRPETFIQVNWQQMDVLYDCVLAGLGDHTGRRVVDAYAGIGVLACYLASSAREVVCIESSRVAARLGMLNASVNEVSDRVRYVVAPVEEVLAQVAAAAPVDLLVLDPPRAGCGGRVTAWLALAGPHRVVYVSCDPATLARDLHVLVASGPYRVESLDVVDMFPQTYHVECVVVLERGVRGAPRA